MHLENRTPHLEVLVWRGSASGWLHICQDDGPLDDLPHKDGCSLLSCSIKCGSGGGISVGVCFDESCSSQPTLRASAFRLADQQAVDIYTVRQACWAGLSCTATCREARRSDFYHNTWPCMYLQAFQQKFCSLPCMDVTV